MMLLCRGIMMQVRCDRVAVLLLAVLTHGIHGQTDAPTAGATTNAPAGPAPLILGMSVNIAIMVFVITAFIVIGLLLFALHQQCSAAKRKRKFSRLLRHRSESNAQYTAPDGSVIDTAMTAIHVEQQSEDDGDVAAALGVLNDSSTQQPASPAVNDADDVDEGVDARTLQNSVNRVGTWLAREAEPPPPPGSPQFLSLRPSSFVDYVHSTNSERDLLLSRKRSSSVATASNVYTRGTRLPPMPPPALVPVFVGGAGGTDANPLEQANTSFSRRHQRRASLPSYLVHRPETFADIPVVELVVSPPTVKGGKSDTKTGKNNKSRGLMSPTLPGRSVSPLSASSDPFA